MGDMADFTNSTLIIRPQKKKTRPVKPSKFKPSFHPDYGKSDDTGYEGF